MFEKMSPKQIESYVTSDARLNIWEGAVRSGKSFSCLLRFLKFVRNGPQGDAIIVGRTRSTIKMNIIGPLQELLGDDLAYKITTGEIKLWGRTIHVVGANDDRAEAKIRGSTFVCALVDELTLIPETFFQMLLSRLSKEGSQLFGTTNPDSPFHWLKTKFIDRPGLNLKTFKFRITDNPSLTKQYIDDISREYIGLWYERFIEGKWVLAEGTVFDFFDREKHVIAAPPGRADYYVVGIDYGTTNPTAFSLIGYSDRTYPNMWLEREYYWDSRKELRQKTDSEYAQELKKFCGGYQVRGIYLDPSAASFRAELHKEGFSTLDADNDVISGIRYHSVLINDGSFKICANCTKSIEEYGTYRWDPQAQKRGEDKPLKENDHLMDSIRYALYSHFFLKSGRRMTAEDLESLRSETLGTREHNLGRFFDDKMW